MFSWDDAKNESNQRKHGVSFAAAKLVFDDPLHVTRHDRIETANNAGRLVASPCCWWRTLGARS